MNSLLRFSRILVVFAQQLLELLTYRDFRVPKVLFGLGFQQFGRGFLGNFLQDFLGDL